MHQLFIDFKKAYDSLRREMLYNIQFWVGLPTKVSKLTSFFEYEMPYEKGS
jgi:hypothetical protein